MRHSYIGITDVQATALRGRKKTIRFSVQMRLGERIKSGKTFAITFDCGTRYSRSWMAVCSRESWKRRSSWLGVR